MGMQVLKSPQGTEGWEGAEDERWKGGCGCVFAGVSGMISPRAPLLCTQLPSIPWGRGPGESQEDRSVSFVLQALSYWGNRILS